MRNRTAGYLAAVFLLLFAFILVCSCGNTAVHEELNGKNEERKVIRIAWWGGEERDEKTNQVLALYAGSHPEIEFETVALGWDDYFDKIEQETAVGSMPDIIQMDYQYITTYSENGSLADLTPFVEDGTIRIQDMDKRFFDCGVVDGRVRGIVLTSSMLAMVYNPEVFDRAGISYPQPDWSWDDFADICLRLGEGMDGYGVQMTPILDMNLYHYWVRQQGEELFSADQTALGYEDDSVYVGYVTLFKSLIDAGAIPSSDAWAAINVQGQEKLPVVTGECGMMPEWSNFAVKVSQANANLKLVTPPLATASAKGEHMALWYKPGMFFSVAETSEVKKECAQFIDWFVNSEEANDILKGERGIPVSEKIRERLLGDETLPQVQREMFAYVEEAMAFCGEIPPSEPAGIEGLNKAFAETANMCFYEVATAEEAAAEFRRRAEEILSNEKKEQK